HTTLILLNVGSDRVTADLQLPLSELELAFGHEVMRQPEQRLQEWGPALNAYLVAHIHPVSETNYPWSVQVGDMRISAAEQTQSGPFQEVVVHVALTPPPGSDIRNFALRYDVIMHQVVTHKALVSVRSDWAGGHIEPSEVGIIAVNTQTTHIDPIRIKLGEGS